MIPDVEPWLIPRAEILGVAGRLAGVSVSEICEDRRTPSRVYARELVAVIGRHYVRPPMSFPEIAASMCRRCHSTAFECYARYRARAAEDRDEIRFRLRCEAVRFRKVRR